MNMATIISSLKMYFNIEGLLAMLNSLLILISSVFVNWGLVPNKLTVEPTVFLVENEYQIVWETKYPAAAWVVVEDVRYTDNLAGNLIWDQNIHKVSVPMDKLDNAREYEIHWQSVKRDLLAVKKGNDNAKTYSFRPADFSDGLQVYNISDNHSILSPADKTARYWGDKLDLLILNGDIISDIHLPKMRSDAIKLAWAVTRGERPVLYTRGNHDMRGKYATDLSRYVGCPDPSRWYYTTRLGPMWIAVYDAGESNPDNDPGLNGMVDNAPYRRQVSAFFDRVIANAETEFDAPDVEYRLLLSHIPVGANFPDTQEYWLGQANQMKLDLAVYGHLHKTEYFASGTYKNYAEPANFPVIIGSRPAHENVGDDFIATALEFQPSFIQGRFTNQNHNVLTELPEIPMVP